jgi:hypothetical protein
LFGWVDEIDKKGTRTNAKINEEGLLGRNSQLYRAGEEGWMGFSCQVHLVRLGKAIFLLSLRGFQSNAR